MPELGNPQFTSLRLCDAAGFKVLSQEAPSNHRSAAPEEQHHSSASVRPHTHAQAAPITARLAGEQHLLHTALSSLPS